MVNGENSRLVIDKDRLCPFMFYYSPKKLVIRFHKEVTAISFFHHCKSLQVICEEAKYSFNEIETITFDFQESDWFDTLALCYVLLFVHNAKKELRDNISFELPKNPEFMAFLLDNGFIDQMRKLTTKIPEISPDVLSISYSKIHRCLLPLQILESKDEISDIVETAKNQLVSIYGMQLPSGELDSTINKLSYFLQETLDNVYAHAYSSSTGPCAILIKRVDCKDIDVANYQKNYISKTPYINISLFENYETYLEVYISDVGCGLRNSFLNDPAGDDEKVTDQNILEYILSSGERSHKKISSLNRDTYFGGLYDIYYQFSKDYDSLGIKGDSSWFFGKRESERLNTEVPYHSYKQLMHGFALVAAIQFKASIPDNYELLSELDLAINSWKNIIFSEDHTDVFTKNRSNICVFDDRAGLANAVKSIGLGNAKTTTVFYPKEFASKFSIVQNLVRSTSGSCIIAGVQESEIKKYRSLVEHFNASKGHAQKVIIVTNTMYIFEYIRQGNTYVYSVDQTKEYIQNITQSIDASFLCFQIWDRVYNSICIWHLVREAKLPVFITSDVKWSDEHSIQGYLDFSQLCRIPLCRDFCIKRLAVLHFLKKDVYFKSVDRFTEEICEHANYQMGNASSNKSVYIGSVFVSGSSTRMSVQKSEIFYFFKHANATESEEFSLFEWASNAVWRDRAFSTNQPEGNCYKRIGLSPFVAKNGADFWAQKHYTNHSDLYSLSQSDTYKVLQRKVGVHPSSAINQLIHPSKYYRQEELLTYYKDSTLVDSKGQSSPRAIREERKFIKSEIEKARKEHCNTINPADAVIIFAVNDEKAAAYRILQLKAENDKKLKKYGLIYQEADVNSCHVVFVIQKEMGMTDASRVTTASILAFRPKIVIMVGICAGKKDETNLGDIVIASGTFDYSLGKMKSVNDESGVPINILQHRPYHSKVDENLDEFLMLMKDPRTIAQETLDIKRDYTGSDRTQKPNTIHVTEMGSGPWVVDTKDVFTDIANSIHSKAYVLDMEAYGVSHAADELKTPWLIVKAVQDFANGEKAKDESDARAYASFASCKFVFRNINCILKSLESE